MWWIQARKDVDLTVRKSGNGVPELIGRNNERAIWFSGLRFPPIFFLIITDQSAMHQ